MNLLKSHFLGPLCLPLPLVAGCLYTDVRTPLAYNSATPGDIGGAAALGQEVHGRACNTIILYLIAVGDGGYDAAVRDAERSSGATLLVDVKADTSITNVLSVYQRQCTEVTARTAPATAAAPAAAAGPATK
jgi:hypothetical protein